MTFGKTKIFQIENKGDYLLNLGIKIILPSISPPENGKFAWVKKIGFAIINKVELLINEKNITFFTSDLLNIYSQMYDSHSQKNVDKLTGNTDDLISFDSKKKPQKVLYVPLNFWFSKDSEAKIPLLAKSKIQLKITLEDINNLVITNSAVSQSFLNNIQLVDFSIVDNIMLTKKPYENEQVIEKILCKEPETISESSESIFIENNLFVKEMFWVLKNSNWRRKYFLGYTHKDDWKNELTEIAKRLLQRSIYLTSESSTLFDGQWTNIYQQNISVVNQSTKNLFVNYSSFILPGDINLMNKIKCSIFVSSENIISITNFSHSLSIKDVSYSIDRCVDTRIPEDILTPDLGDILCNFPFNYGCYVDGSKPPIVSVEMTIDGIPRIDKMEAEYFNYYVPTQKYETKFDKGIYAYLFSNYSNKYSNNSTSSLENKIERKPSNMCSFLNTFGADKILFNIEVSENSEEGTIYENSRLHIFMTCFERMKIEDGIHKFTVLKDKK